MTIRIVQGDCREVLRAMKDASVHEVITSPPYWGLRDYLTASWTGGDPDCGHVVGEIRTGVGLEKLGERYSGGGHKAAEPLPVTARHECPHCGAIRVDSQIGLERTPDDYVDAIVGVFREIWRVLRDDGVVFLNLGDTYATRPYGDRHTFDPTYNGRRRTAGYPNRSGPKVAGLKHKDLVGIPWMVAFALRAEGWYLRSSCIWEKPNPMPESVVDRPSKCHEDIFMFSKSGHPLFWTHRDKPIGARKHPDPDYRWADRDNRNAETAIEPEGWKTEKSTKEPRRKRWWRINLWTSNDYYYDAEAVREVGVIPAGTLGAKGSEERSGIPGVNSRPPEYKVYDGTRNLRTVWKIATRPFAEAHFATFPPDLPEICIKAGSSERGCCAACGAPWARMSKVSEEYAAFRGVGFNDHTDDLTQGRQQGRGTNRQNDMRDIGGIRHKQSETIGWQPTCECAPAETVPCTVLDPFAGAGTTCLVADRLGRNAEGIELNHGYAAMSRRRVTADSPLFVVHLDGETDDRRGVACGE